MDIERIGTLYLRVLTGIAADASISSATSLLNAEEARKLTHETDRVDDITPVDDLSCIHEVVFERARACPEAIAVACGRRKVSYAELERSSGELARQWRRRGIGRGSVVAIAMDRSIESVIAVLAVLRAGAGYVPLDPSSPPARLEHMVVDASARILITQRHHYDHCARAAAQTLCIEDELNEASGGLATAEGQRVDVSPQSLAYVIYTSGSAGKPKGVVISHQNLMSSTRARHRYYTEPLTAFLWLSPLWFDSSVAGLFWTLSQGGTLILPQSGEEREPQRLLRLIEQHRVSHLLCIGSLYAALLEEQAAGDQARSLRVAIVAGEACMGEWVKRHHEVLPQARMFNEYGPTEATVWSSVHACSPSQLMPLTPIGMPTPGALLYILDEWLQPVPIGMPGELYIGGAGVAQCYLGQASLTAERFVPDAFNGDGARMYRSGDLARYDEDGRLLFLGRRDEQVKLRGHRIDLAEIEAALLADTDVKEASVVAHRNAIGGLKLTAYVVYRPGRSADIAQTRRRLQQQLPSYMIPATFHPLQGLPYTANGKLDRARLDVQVARKVALLRQIEGPETSEVRELLNQASHRKL